MNNTIMYNKFKCNWVLTYGWNMFSTENYIIVPIRDYCLTNYNNSTIISYNIIYIIILLYRKYYVNNYRYEEDT